jgi:GNAT superfamily N-acetyltransferase
VESSEIVVRALGPETVEAAVALWQETFAAAFPRAWARMDLARTESGLRHALADRTVWVAERGGAVVGFAARRGPRLRHLYVAVRSQRSGVGSRLLRAAREGAPGWLELETFAEGFARAFYEKHGFVLTSARARRAWGEPVVAYEWHESSRAEEIG